jgi:hypothetical protein
MPSPSADPKFVLSILKFLSMLNFLQYTQNNFGIQQGLEIRGFWFQKKTVQLKPVFLEVYTYVLNEIFF